MEAHIPSNVSRRLVLGGTGALFSTTALARPSAPLSGIKPASGEMPVFHPGDSVRILTRAPIGHYRVPFYVRGKRGTVERVIEPTAVDNEEEAYGHNAGPKRHYYRLAISMGEIWPDYDGSPSDGLRIEVFETWLERC
jgi:nitrile hydratase